MALWPTPPAAYVGRADLLHALVGQWRRACAGQPRLVLVGGPAGIGKTALIEQFLTAVGMPATLRATGDELEARLPLGVVDQLTGAGGRPDAGDRRSHDPLAAGAALVRVLGESQASAPLAVVVDDAHWADTPSLQALTFAFRRLQAERVLCVVVHRDDPLGLPESLRRAAASERGLTLRLDGLSVSDLVGLGERLGVGRMRHRVAARLAEHTGGNPLYAIAFLRELGPEALQETTTPLPAPQVFSLATIARVADCSTETQELVLAAAVLGHRCQLAVAGRVAGVDHPLVALEEAMEARLLQPLGGSFDEITFSHPLVRAAIYHDLRPTRRSALHGRAADLLDGPASLEHRAAAGVGPDASLAGALVAQARAEAHSGAWVAAAAHMDIAVRVEPDQRVRERLELEAVDLLLRGGEIAAAEARQPRLATLPPSAAKEAVLGHLATITGRQEEAERALAAAWHAAAGEDETTEVAAGAAALLSQLLLAQARGAESATWARRAMDASTDAFTRGMALSVLVGALSIQGRARDGLALVADMPVGATDLSAVEVEGVMGRGVASLWTGDLVTARADLSTIIGLASPWRTMRARTISLGHLALAEFLLGAWDDSVAHAHLGVSLVTDTDYVWITPLMQYSATLALAGRGKWAAAHAHAVAAVDASQVLGDASGVGYAGTAAAWVAYCQAQPDQVLAAVGPILDLPHRDGIHEPGVLGWQGLHVEALVALGRLTEARAVLEPVSRMAAERGHPLAVGAAARARGLLEAAAGNRAAALAAFDAGAEALDDVPAPFERALLEHSYGQVLRRHGRRRRAIDRLQEARQVYADLAAEPFLGRCDRELEASGLAPARRRPEERLRLTPRELAVARLVARGLTNREAARELVISDKTVEYHLGNVYAKLGLRSRTELAAHLQQRQGHD